jgi:hypothetical protein
MDTVWTSIKAWDHAFNDVTKLCLAATAGCFAVGGLFLLADGVVALGPRGIALLVVGCFFLIHALFEVVKQWWQSKAQEPSGNVAVDEPTASAANMRGESGARTAA